MALLPDAGPAQEEPFEAETGTPGLGCVFGVLLGLVFWACVIISTFKGCQS